MKLGEVGGHQIHTLAKEVSFSAADDLRHR